MEKNTRIFILFLVLNLLLNYDSGVIPASLLEISKELNFGYKEQSLLGSLVYLGLCSLSLFASPVISKFGAKLVLSFSCLLNALSCFAFAYSDKRLVLFTARFMMGATMAFLVIYGPVWVNNYSPSNKNSTWMGLLHGCTIFGLVFGYIVAGAINSFFGKMLTWRFAIELQGILIIPFAILLCLEDSNDIDLCITGIDNELFEMHDSIFRGTIQRKKNYTLEGRNIKMIQKSLHKNALSERNPRELDHNNIINDNLQNENNNFYRQSEASYKPSGSIFYEGDYPMAKLGFIKQSYIVLCNKLYLFVTLGLSAIYFVVTSIQFWVTAYLIDIIGAPQIYVIAVFSFVTVTAPLMGVLVGGTLSDDYGGYKGKNVYKAIQMAFAFGIISFFFSFPCGFLFNFSYISIFIWVLLFFGAAVVPVATGIMISCVPRECQATSSSLSQMIFNLLGYFLSPALTGFVMDMFSNKKKGFIWGVRVGFWWSLFAVIFLGCSLFITRKKKKEHEELEEESDKEEMEQDFIKYIQIEIKRRMAVSLRSIS